MEEELLKSTIGLEISNVEIYKDHWDTNIIRVEYTFTNGQKLAITASGTEAQWLDICDR